MKRLFLVGCIIMVSLVLFSQEETISLDLKGADLRDVLRMFAEKYDFNLLVGKDVQGTVTVTLHDVYPKEALRLILNINGYDYIKEGNIIKVVAVPSTTQKEKVIDPFFRPQSLVSKIIPLKNIDANTAISHIQKYLSEHGKAEVFLNKGVEASDRILVRDLPRNIKKIEDIIRNLDQPIPQVLIEARFIDALSDISKELGFVWEWNKNLTELDNAFIRFTGNVLPLPSPLPTSGDNLDLTIQGNPSSPDHYLDVTLQALENQGKVNLLDSPRVLVQSGHKADIKVITELPYVEYTEVTTGETGTTPRYQQQVKFKEEGVKLEVTPFVREDNEIEMNIRASVMNHVGDFEYEPFPDITATIPLIHTREANTRVKVRSGGILVIGGLKYQRSTLATTKVPLLGDIPGLGLLFRSRTRSQEERNLMIFIIPRVLTGKEGERLARREESRMKKELPLFVDKLLEEGKEYLRYGELEKAERKFKEALKSASPSQRRKVLGWLDKVEELKTRKILLEKPQEKGNKGYLYQKER